MESLKYKKIVLLCDYGLDDAAATSYILEHYGYFDKIDIIPIAGNVPLNISFKNAMRIIENLEIVPKNVSIIDSSSIEQYGEYLDYIHGKDGMGDFLSEEYNLTIGTIDFNTWIKTLTKDYLVVSLGPCTVTERILKHIDLPLLIMGGNISEKPNYKGYEFNHGMNISAFETCVKHSHVIATLDTCHNKYCDFYQINITDNNLSSRFVQRSVELSRQRKEEAAYIYDLITIVYLFNPEKFTIIPSFDKDGNKLFVLHYIDDVSIL